MFVPHPAWIAVLLVLIAAAWPFAAPAAERVVVVEHYTNFR
jgi:hypothetical protein